MAGNAPRSFAILTLLALYAAELALGLNALLSKALTGPTEPLHVARIEPVSPPRVTPPARRPGIGYWRVPIERRNIFESGVVGPYPRPPPKKTRGDSTDHRVGRTT